MTLTSRIADLAGAVRDKINLMVPRLIPPGGGSGQVLSKSSATDYAVGWTDAAGGGGGPMAALELEPNETAPAAPATGLNVYARTRAGTEWLDVQRPSGRDFPLQPHFGVNRVARWSPSVTTTINTDGMPRTVVGTVSTPLITATNKSTVMRRWRVTSAATANAVADERSATPLCCRGWAAGLGGFTYTNRLSLVTLQPAARAFFGLLRLTTALPTTQAITALVDCIGIGFTNGTDTNWQLLHNDASGAPTATDMGSDFPVDNTTNVYTLIIRASPNDTSVWVEVVNEISGAVFEQEITTNLPADNTLLTIRNYMNNGGAAASVAYECSGIYLETDY